MTLKAFNIDVSIAEAFKLPETRENRITRSQLRLSSLWKVLGKTIKPTSSELNDSFPDIPLTENDQCKGDVVIHVAWNGSDTHKCPHCGHKCNIIGYVTRMYRHIDDLGYRCFIHSEIPKYSCCSCGKTLRQRFPIAEPNVSYTRHFAMVIVGKLKEETVSAVSKEFNTSRDIVNGILTRTIRKAYREQDLSYVTGVYVDETQFGSGHDYISVFLDQKHKVIFACKGHGKEVLDLFKSHLIIQGGDPENIHFFSADMSVSYEAGITEMFPNATLVWDRFHLMKNVNEALNAVRKRAVRRGDEPLKLVKYTLLHRRKNMKRKHVERLRQMRIASPELGQAFDMKETFAEIIKIPNPAAMSRNMHVWVDWVMLDGPKEFKKKAERFLEKLERIVSWTKYRISNSVSEGVNKKIQDIRRNAYGYRNMANFIDMIFLRMGTLELRF